MEVKRFYLIKNRPEETTLEDLATFLHDNDSITFDADEYDIEFIASGCATDILKISFSTKQSEEEHEDE